MKIAFMSGKGGTGKTSISVSFAYLIKNSYLVDCDVEEPNAHLICNLKENKRDFVKAFFPSIDYNKCNFCGFCGNFCSFKAILPAKNKVLIMQENCHFCGGCQIVCPQKAISYESRDIGEIIYGKSAYGFDVKYGILNIGELSGVRVIKKTKENLKNKNKIFVIDCPPGSSCAAAEAVDEVDFVVVVSEPTPFGISDMKMVIDMLRQREIPFGVFVNKCNLGNKDIYKFCKKEKIDLLGELPFDKNFANDYAKGELFTYKSTEHNKVFITLYNEIKRRVNYEKF